MLGDTKIFNIIVYNDSKQNKDLFNKVEQFVEALKTDEKTILLKNCRMSFFIRTEDEVIYLKRNQKFVYKKSELLEFVKMGFLLIIFLENKAEKVDIFIDTIIDDFEKHYKVQETRFFIDAFECYLDDDNTADTNKVFLYSDKFGFLVTDFLKKVKGTQHPLIKLVKMLVNSNPCDTQMGFFIFFSMIKKDSVIMSFDEIKNCTDFIKMIDFIVNGELIIEDFMGEYISKDLKEFQYSLREGYFNKSSLLIDVLAWLFRHKLIPFSSLDQQDFQILLRPVVV